MNTSISTKSSVPLPISTRKTQADGKSASQIGPTKKGNKSIPAKCRVPLFVGNRRIEFGERAVPEVGPGQLLLQVHANALCSSERPQFFEGTSVVPGHEASGTV